MIDTTVSYLSQWNTLIALWIYWIPAAVCMFFSVKDFDRKYRQDIDYRQKAVEANQWFRSDITIGLLLLHIVAPFIPVYNVIRGFFEILNGLHKAFKVLDWKLIPDYTPPKHQ